MRGGPALPSLVPALPKRCDATRADLVAYERELRRNLGTPDWIRRLLFREQRNTVADALDRRVKRLLDRAGAIERRRPFVRLSRIAQHLGASVLLSADLDMAKRHRVTRDGNVVGASHAHGVIVRSRNGRWLIEVAPSNDAETRFIVAHELAHGLICWDGHGRVNESTWRRFRGDAFTEIACDYIARSILGPEPLARLGNPANPAEHILSRLHRELQMPLRHSILHWAESRADPNTIAVVVWGQHHPLDRHYVHSCLRDFPKLRDRALSAMTPLRSFADQLDPQAWYRFWRSAVNCHSKGLNERDLVSFEHWLPNKIAAVHDEFRDLFSKESVARHVDAEQRAECFAAIQSLGDPSFARTMTPTAFAFADPNDRRYIPIRKCSAGRGSLVAELAAESIAEACGLAVGTKSEDVAVGSFQGRYRVHACGTGSAATGNRFVVVVYDRTPANESDASRHESLFAASSTDKPIARFRCSPSTHPTRGHAVAPFHDHKGLRGSAPRPRSAQSGRA